MPGLPLISVGHMVGIAALLPPYEKREMRNEKQHSVFRIKCTAG